MHDFADPDDPTTIRIPFIFVPRGHPPPTEWLRDHPGAFRVPAMMVWRNDGKTEEARIDLNGNEADSPPATSSVPTQQAEANPIHLAQLSTLMNPALNPGVALPPATGPFPHSQGAPNGGDMLTRLLNLLLAGKFRLPLPRHTDEPQSGATTDDPWPSRHPDLTPPLRTYTKRAQRSAALADAKTKEVLDSNQREVHHLINAASAPRFVDLLTAAERTGWNINEPANVITLPSTQAAQAKLAAKGIFLPYHDNPHDQWNTRVRIGLGATRIEADRVFGSQDSAAKDSFIRFEIETLQASLRAYILMLDRVVENSAPLLNQPVHG